MIYVFSSEAQLSVILACNTKYDQIHVRTPITVVSLYH